MKWKKNAFGGRKVVEQATLLVHWAQKLSGRLPALHIGSAASAAQIYNTLDVLSRRCFLKISWYDHVSNGELMR